MRDLQLRQYTKPTSTLETLFDDVQADLEDTIDQLNNKLEKLDEQGHGYG
jgi:ubiquinone biosynthesis protein UbiJ